MIYTFFSWIAWSISLPFIALLSFKRKFRLSLPARFLLYKNPPLPSCDIHFHACSFGEVSAIEPLVSHFDECAITTVTQTGFEKAGRICTNVRYMPFENFLPFWLKASKVVVIFEAELWLNIVRTAKKNGSYVVLLNARISDESYKKYKKFASYYKKVFENIDAVIAQSELDADRLRELGAGGICVLGNIKSANLPKPTKTYQKPRGRLITLASTHEGEEELILRSLKLEKNDTLIIAPRHPERFLAVSRIVGDFAKANSLTYERFTQNLSLDSQVILLDTLGELVNFYAISDVVVLCGSFLPNIGGHNPIEAAQFGCSIISGRNYHNQKALYALIEGLQMCEAEQISTLLGSNLPNTKIVNRCNLDEILDFLKDKCGYPKSV